MAIRFAGRGGKVVSRPVRFAIRRFDRDVSHPKWPRNVLKKGAKRPQTQLDVIVSIPVKSHGFAVSLTIWAMKSRSQADYVVSHAFQLKQNLRE